MARVGGELRDLSHVLADGDAVEPVTIDSPGRAGRPAALGCARPGPGRAAGEPAGPARHRPARSGTASTTTSTSTTPFTPEDLKALEKVMQKVVNESQTYRRRVVTRGRGAGRAGRRAVQARADRAQGRPRRQRERSRDRGRRRRGRRGRADDLRQPAAGRVGGVARPVSGTLRQAHRASSPRTRQTTGRYRRVESVRQTRARVRSSRPARRPGNRTTRSGGCCTGASIRTSGRSAGSLIGLVRTLTLALSLPGRGTPEMAVQANRVAG